MNTGEAKVLLEEVSPNGNVVAVVEADANSCHFYLHGDESTNFGVKSCWVRNLRPAPEIFDVSGMRNGVPPMLPRSYCKHPNGDAPLNPKELSIVWTEEGDAAALQERGEIIAIIPSWSGNDGFHGYARDCSGESQLCWELGTPETNAQFDRYQRAAEYWRTWDTKDVWKGFQQNMLGATEARFGKESNYYAIDGGKWPPKALLRIPAGDSIILVTIGMSLRAQPRVELYNEDPAPFRRIELVDSSLPDQTIQNIGSYMSGQSAYPWNFYTFLGHGHTIPSDAFGAASGNRFPFALLQTVEGMELPSFRDDPINLLWMTPISTRERQFAESNGASTLIERLRAKGNHWRASFTRIEGV